MRKNRAAIIGIVLSIISIFSFGLLSLPAFLFSAKGYINSRRMNGKYKSLSCFGMVFSGIQLLIFSAVLIWSQSTTRNNEVNMSGSTTIIPSEDSYESVEEPTTLIEVTPTGFPSSDPTPTTTATPTAKPTSLVSPTPTVIPTLSPTCTPSPTPPSVKQLKKYAKTIKKFDDAEELVKQAIRDGYFVKKVKENGEYYIFIAVTDKVYKCKISMSYASLQGADFPYWYVNYDLDWDKLRKAQEEGRAHIPSGYDEDEFHQYRLQWYEFTSMSSMRYFEPKD